MSFDLLSTPLRFFESVLGPYAPLDPGIVDYAAWWQAEGAPIADAIDRAGVPMLRTHDRIGRRVDEILYPPEYARLLARGYAAGVVRRTHLQETLLPGFALGYITSFYDPGLYCPYTVSSATRHIVDKYAPEPQRAAVLERLHAAESAWQGATWMTEFGGGSDLGASVATVARRDGDGWRLTGDKSFCSNVGAEVALVVARPEGAADGVRGLALFLTPRQRDDGSLNYTVRRLKTKTATHSVPTGEVELRDSQATLMGADGDGLSLIMEVLNLSRAANSIASVALAQRALADAYAFASQRVVFGRPLVEQPLMRRQFEERVATLRAALALAWATAQTGDYSARELPGFYSDTYQLFRLQAHLAKFWTAEVAVDAARWAMEVHGGAGVLAEHGVERWLREAMILNIWEGPPQRQILDGLEAMARKQAHHLLLADLADDADADACAALRDRLDAHVALPRDEREAGAEPVFRELALFAANAYARRFERLLSAVLVGG